MQGPAYFRGIELAFLIYSRSAPLLRSLAYLCLFASHHHTTSRLSEGLVVANHARPVTGLAGPELLHGLLQTRLTDLELLNPRLKTLVRCELQHLKHLAAAAQVGAADEATVLGEVLVADVEALTTGHTDRVPATVDVEEGEVLVEVETIGGVGGVDDEVKGHLVRLVPVLL